MNIKLVTIFSDFLRKNWEVNDDSGSSLVFMLDRKVREIKSPFTRNLYHKLTLQIIRQ